MSDLIEFDYKSSGRMNSVQLVDIINEYRKKEGNDSVLQHSHFLQKIEKELNGDEANFRSTYLDGSNRNSKCYLLPKDECILMLMSESRIVRKGVLNKLNQLESQLPKTFSEALLLAGNFQKQLEEQAPKIRVFDRVLDGMNTYTLDTVSDTLNIGRTTLCKLLESKKWKMLTSKDGTASTRYSEINGYAKTVFEVIPIGNNREKKIKKFVLTKKGLDKLISEL